MIASALPAIFGILVVTVQCELGYFFEVLRIQFHVQWANPNNIIGKVHCCWIDRYIVTEPPRPAFDVRFGSPGSAGPFPTVLLLSLLKISSNGENFGRCKFCPAPPCHSSHFGAASRYFAHFLQYVVGGLEGIEAGWNPTIDRGVQ